MQDLQHQIKELRETMQALEKALLDDRDTCPTTFSAIAGEHTKKLEDLKETVERGFSDFSKRIARVEPVADLFEKLSWLRSTFASLLIGLAILGGGIAVMTSGITWFKAWILSEIARS